MTARPHRIVFANEKGGTGKSTTAVHVAVALAFGGARVAAFDLDHRQRTMCRYFENRAETMKRRGIELPTAQCHVVEGLEEAGMEALIAAVYRDGGFTEAQALILRLWNTRITSVKADARDPKTALQEWVQARKGPPPNYVELSRSGPDHAPQFEIEVRLHSGEAAQAKAGSKRQAEQAAAKLLLERLGA